MVHTGTNILMRLRKLEQDYMLTSGEMKTVHQARILIKELYDLHNVDDPKSYMHSTFWRQHP